MSGPASQPAVRVLHVYSGNLFGGVERFLVTLARLRDAAPGMQSEFALCFDGRLRQELTEAGASVHTLGQVRLSRPWTVPAARRALHRVLEKGEFDVVATHSGWLHAVFAKAVRADAKSRLVRWAHESPGEGWLDRYANRFEPDGWIANSRYTLEHSPGRGKGTVVYLPVAPEVEAGFDRAAVRAKLDCGPDHIAVLCFSRLERWKGHRTLMSALARVGQAGNWVCWIAGGVQRAAEAAYLAELQELARRLNIAHRVRFLGERRDVAWLIAAADVHCQPNTGPEPFGIAFIEAMYGGLAPVTTAIGGAAEIVQDGVNGLLVPPGDEQTLAAALDRVMNDPSLRRALGENARVRAGELCEPVRQMRKIEQEIRRVAFEEGPV
jgi:glycosyltransferase involved in cell wall biosynthesis